MNSVSILDVRNQYRDAAEQFCAVILNASSQHQYSLLGSLWVQLSHLYAAATQLPEVAPDTDLNTDIVISVDEGAAVERVLASTFGDLPIPWNIFDPFEEQPDPVRGRLTDDLMDIYIDVMSGLLLEENGAPPGDVMWAWRFSFQVHWGRHALWALGTIHHLLIDNHVTEGHC